LISLLTITIVNSQLIKLLVAAKPETTPVPVLGGVTVPSEREEPESVKQYI
jgi:hypothetical protein